MKQQLPDSPWSCDAAGHDPTMIILKSVSLKQEVDDQTGPTSCDQHDMNAQHQKNSITVVVCHISVARRGRAAADVQVMRAEYKPDTTPLPHLSHQALPPHSILTTSLPSPILHQHVEVLQPDSALLRLLPLLLCHLFMIKHREAIRMGGVLSIQVSQWKPNMSQYKEPVCPSINSQYLHT